MEVHMELQMKILKKIVKIVIIISTVILAIYTSILLFKEGLNITNQEIITKDTYILKDSLLMNNILFKVAIDEIYVLTMEGKYMTKKTDKEEWLQKVLIYVHYLNLEKDVTCKYEPYTGQKTSTLVNILLWIRTDPSIDMQVSRTIGILNGFRAALNSQKESQF